MPENNIRSVKQNPFTPPATSPTELTTYIGTPPIAEVLERWEGILFPIVLIGLGIVILVSGGAFGL